MPELTLGEWVRERRDSHNLTREQLAAMAGTSTSTVTRLEREDRVPGAVALAAIARVLGVSVDHLLELERAKAAS